MLGLMDATLPEGSRTETELERLVSALLMIDALDAAVRA